MSHTDDDLEKGLRPATSSMVDQGQARSPGPLSSPPDRPLPSSQHSPPPQTPSSPIPPPPQVATHSPPTVLQSHIQPPPPPPPPQQQQHSTPRSPQQIASAIPNAATQEAQQDSYINPSDKLWALYLKEADKEDEHLVESWKGDTEGILIFTGLFAATVATFVTQTYQLLIPSSEDTSTAIQLQMSHQLAGLSNGTYIPAYVPPPFEAPFYAVWVNTLWFLSLFLSLTGALMATLMQQWTRRYLRGIRYRSTPNIRGPIHVALRLGVKTYRMKQAVAMITSIIHASVFIFFAGLVGFAFNLNSTVANVLTASVSALVAIYITLSALPMISTVAPYDTVLTPALQASLRLGRFLSAFTLGQGQRALYFFESLRRESPRGTEQESKENTEDIVEDTKEQRPRSREQDLMQVVRRNEFLTARRTSYVLDRILTNADELHEVENFLDSMAVLLSDANTREARRPIRDFAHIRSNEDYESEDTESDDHLYHKSLIDGQMLGAVFERYSLNRKILSLLESCDDSASNGASSGIRIKRLRTIVMFITHIRRVRRIPHDTRMIIDRLRSHGGQLLHSLSRDPDPSSAFLSRLMAIGHVRRLGYASHRDYYLTHVQPVADRWYTGGEDTNAVAWPLFHFVELVCTILKYAISGGVDDPVAAYYDLWEPMLSHRKDSAMGCLLHTQWENGELIAQPIPRALLVTAGLGDLVHSFYSPPARQPPTEEEQLEIKSVFYRYPELAAALREVAETLPLVPLYGLSPQPNLGPEDLTVQRRSAAASIPITAEVGWVLFGPLTWRNRPAQEYRRLVRAWGRGDFFTDIIDDACEVLQDHPRGDGYARICFKKREDARRFADEWTRHRPPAYRVVTAEILDDDRDDTSGDGTRDAVDAREEVEAQAQGRSQAGVSDPSHTWVERYGRHQC